MDSLLYLLIVITYRFIACMKTEILFITDVIIYFANRVRVQFAVYDVLYLYAKGSVNLDIKNPLNLIQCQFILTVLQVHQGFKNMGLGIVLCVLDGTLNIQFSPGFFGSHKIQTRKAAAQIIKGSKNLSFVKLEREQVEVGDIVEIVIIDGNSEVIYRCINISQLRVKKSSIRIQCGIQGRMLNALSHQLQSFFVVTLFETKGCLSKQLLHLHIYIINQALPSSGQQNEYKELTQQMSSIINKILDSTLTAIWDSLLLSIPLLLSVSPLSHLNSKEFNSGTYFIGKIFSLIYSFSIGGEPIIAQAPKTTVTLNPNVSLVCLARSKQCAYSIGLTLQPSLFFFKLLKFCQSIFSQAFFFTLLPLDSLILKLAPLFCLV